MRKHAIRRIAIRLGAACAVVGVAAALAEQPLPFASTRSPADRAKAAIDASLHPPGAPSVAAGQPEPTALLPDVADLQAGLDALAEGDVAASRAVRDRLGPASLDAKLLTFAIAMSGDLGVSSGEIQAAAIALRGWPGVETMRRNAERALLREKPAPAVVVRAFGGGAPETIEGAIVLARAHQAMANPSAALAALAPMWRSARLSPGIEAVIIREFGALIPTADHRIRMEQMLYDDRIASAERVADLAQARPLADAWSAVLRRAKDAPAKLDAVPQTMRGAGYIFARARHLRWSGKFAEAADAMLDAPDQRQALIDPDAWWVERRVLSRELLDAGDAKTAYRLAAAHAAESPEMAADAEFHAGWYALVGLSDPTAATPHFQRIVALAQGPISRARGHYWLGRAAQESGQDATPHYERAAVHGAAFYGQIAAAKLGRRQIDASLPASTPEDRLTFERRETVAAIRRLEAAGAHGRASLLYRELAAELGGAGELTLLASMAESRGDHFLALRIGKIAAGRGLEIGALAHPTGAIPSSTAFSAAGQALAYAVARQESEFNVSAVSRAGAQGLLQLMPATARAMARKSGLDYSASRLTSDAGYNAALGAAFLTDQLDRFDGSYVLTFVGYNAGPRRAEDWVRRYGDPRGGNIDAVVDWIERIPFTETRNYVQRVMENYQIYKTRLAGRFDIASDLTRGR